MAYMHVYKNNPTAGAADGQQVSEGDGGNPITVGPLNVVDNEESEPIKLAIRCETGYQTSADTTITPTGTTAAKWALAPDNSGSPGTFGAYGAALTLSSGIGAANVLFWAKSKATSDESPTNDSTVDLHIQCTTITAV